jgi:hypothetical protein
MWISIVGVYRSPTFESLKNCALSYITGIMQHHHTTQSAMAPATQQFYIPNLLSILNLQSNTNPHEDVVREETEKWVYDYGIFTDAKWDKFLESDSIIPPHHSPLITKMSCVFLCCRNKCIPRMSRIHRKT